MRPRRSSRVRRNDVIVVGEDNEGGGSHRRTRQRKAMVEKNFDGLSDLPDHLAHHILSFLPTKDVLRTSVLSKRWDFLCLTFPSFDFDETRFIPYGLLGCRRKFLDCMHDSLRRRDNPFVQKLRICTLTPRDDELDHLLDRYLHFALRSKLQVLELSVRCIYCLKHDACGLHYQLPDNFFGSVKYLTSLVLESCEFGDHDHQVVNNFAFLRNLYLKYMNIPQEILQKLISSSPVLFSVTLVACIGFRVLKVHNPSVKILAVGRCREVKELELDTPNLITFNLNGALCISNNLIALENSSEILTFKVKNVNSVNSLKTLIISYIQMKDSTLHFMLSCFQNLELMRVANCVLFGKFPLIINEKLDKLEMDSCHFDELVTNASQLRNSAPISEFRNVLLGDDINGGMKCSNITALTLVGHLYFPDLCLRLASCPNLEALILRNCDNLTFLKLDSKNLKCLIVDCCLNLENGNIDTPNLKDFYYIGYLLDFTHMIVPHGLNVRLHIMNSGRLCFTHDLQELKLWGLLARFQYAKSLTITSESGQFVAVPRKVQLCPSLHFVEHLKVKTVLDHMSSYVTFLLEVLHISYCRKILSIDLGTCKIELKFGIETHDDYYENLISSCILFQHDCIRNHLLEARLIISEGNLREMELIRFLMAKAIILRKMLVSFIPELRPAVDPLLFSRAHRILKSFPKASQLVQVIVDI
ncbi:hypothetical protein FNV43_RR13529 [Rhamnella rubrinervis]|uniref:F-box domain-containing protein n=1 Tax=Rhamnella rubrinervis TaxID=2594499 RepID=A0A8K0MED8_9ROSA|nr:hypothetical protein FNV43_RR13529 [Rhamnella rubrinervis]